MFKNIVKLIVKVEIYKVHMESIQRMVTLFTLYKFEQDLTPLDLCVFAFKIINSMPALFQFISLMDVTHYWKKKKQKEKQTFQHSNNYYKLSCTYRLAVEAYCTLNI